VIVVAGAGMAGLVAGARLRELGVAPIVLEKGNRAGGSMLLSSGVAWRHASLADFREECPGGDEALQRLIVERLDGALDWLETLGAPVLEADTGNPRTVGRRFETQGLTRVLCERAGDVRLLEPLEELGDDLVVLATGGFGGVLARRLGLPLRANPWSEGDGLSLARARNADVSSGMDEFYGRAMPAPPARVEETDYVRLAQVYGRHALVLDEAGMPIEGPPAWHEADVVQEIARRPGGRAWYLVSDDALGVPASGRASVVDQVDAARAAGGAVLSPAELPFPAPGGYRYAVHVIATITHTIGGLRIDEHARVLDEDGAPLDGLLSAGVDAGGVAGGGYASGLAAALVLGLTAAETAHAMR
jgi:fumarate reductase flavoprotein subunit